MSALAGVLERAGERATPVLVKEVRAALRGKWFRVAFAVTLGTALCASLAYVAWAVVQKEELNGIAYASLMFACLILGTHAILPFSALLSMQAESDENTLELLQLTTLPPWRIVSGKILAALVQSGVLYGALLPFLAVAFLLRGVGVEAIALGVVVSFAYCAALCSIASFLGTFGRSRFVRVLAMAGFGLFLLQSVQLAAMYSLFAFGASMFVPMGGVFVGSFVVTLITGYAAALAFALACARVAHVEENRSTPMRLVASATLLIGIALALVAWDASKSFAMLITTVMLLALPLGLVASEREALPRAVRVSKSSGIALLASPWLPGGGRGVLFLLLHLAAPLVVLCVITFFEGGSVVPLSQLAIACLFGAIYVLVPCAVFAPFVKTNVQRIVLRVSMAVFMVGTLVVGITLSPFAGASDATQAITRVLVPFLLANVIANEGWLAAWPPFLFVVAVLALALALNTPRVVRGLSEVVRRSRARHDPRTVPSLHAGPVRSRERA